jgi:peptidoglycan hydrolase-like protein with peptidoglycan-binding domain
MTLRLSRALRVSVLMALMAVVVAVSAAFTGGSTARASNDASRVSPQAALAVNCPVSGHPTISRGSSGRAVERAQCLLNLSLDPSFHTPLAVDGSFGPLTDGATHTFQSCVGIQDDGIIGPVTWPKLETVAASPSYAC